METRNATMRKTLLLYLAVTLAATPAPAVRAPTSRALIVAISAYGSPPPDPLTKTPRMAYRTLNAKNDVPLVRGALMQQGFAEENIRLLADSAATRDGILAAFDQLVRASGEGDVVVIHYSGHGHQIADDDGDEMDGYDEVLVPYGAPSNFVEGYRGELHVRDDEVGAFLQRLRRKVGPTGNVTVFLDACYSGTGTRGADELPSRGEPQPLGPPAPVTTARGAEPVDATGFELPEPGTRSAGGVLADDRLAPFAVLSAASHKEVAWETYDVDGTTKVGSLSYALARSIPRLEPGDSYRVLFDYVVEAMAGKVPQAPQLEGDRDVDVFGNRLRAQAPYAEVDTVLGDAAIITAGSLLGVNEGSVVEFHRRGTADPGAATPLVTGTVTASTPLASRVRLEGAAPAGLNTAWAFVTRTTFGDLAARVKLSPNLDASTRSALEGVFDGSGLVQIVDEGADVILIPGPDGLAAHALPDRRLVAGGRAGVAPEAVARGVVEFARSLYLRRLNMSSPTMPVRVELRPVQIETDLLGRATGCTAADWSAKAAPVGVVRMAPGDAYRVRVSNDARMSLFITLLDLMPDGSVSQLFPHPEYAPGLTDIPAGGTYEIPLCFTTEDMPGQETLKLFATVEPVDFTAVVQSRGSRGAADDQQLSPLEELWAASFGGTRAGIVPAPRGAAVTAEAQILIQRHP
jgi:hypothetical protein